MAISLVTQGVEHDHTGRTERLRAAMGERRVDAVYLTAGPNMFYFMGFSGYPGGWPLWLTGAVITPTGGIAILNKMHRDIASYATTWVKDVRVYEDGDDVVPYLAQVLRDAGATTGRIGIESALATAELRLLQQAAPTAEFVDVQDAIDDLRMVKDALEISLIRKACEASVAGFRACHTTATVGTPGVTVAMAVLQAMTANGTLGSPLGPFRHVMNRPLQHGDIIACDLGGRFRNYGSDAARTVFVGGISDELARIYDILLDSRQTILRMIGPGVMVEDIHREACRLVRRTGYEQPWRIGHGIGLGPSHEQPLLQFGSRVVCRPGMVFTIDPGIHFQHPERDLPIAIEDDVLVTDSGCEVLTEYETRVVTA